MAYNHGIRVDEVPTSIVTPINGTAGLQVIFGTAPVNTVANPSAAVNKLVYASSFEEAKEALGYSEDFESYTLCQSMYAAFQIFGVAPVIFCNVLDPATHKTSLDTKSYTVTGSQAIIDTEGVIADSISVSDGETSLVAGTDYFTSFNDDGYLVLTFAGSHSSVTVSGDAVNPSAVTASDIVGGVNSVTGEETGIELVRKVYPKFGVTAGLLSAPGWSTNSAVAAALSSKTVNINGCFKALALIDLDTTTIKKYSDVPEAKKNAGFNSKHDILLWPMVKSVSGKKMAYSAVYGSLIAYTDAINDDVPSMSPSNKNLGIGGTCLADGTDVVLDEVQANVINGAGVVTAVNQNGWKSWGNNTACYPDNTDPKDRWICCRRFFSWWENTFILTYKNKVDDLANYKLVESIVDSENIRGNSYVAQGKLAGIHMEFNIADNPVSSIIDGRIRFKTYLAPFTPAEDILNEFEFDPTMITDALSR